MLSQQLGTCRHASRPIFIVKHYRFPKTHLPSVDGQSRRETGLGSSVGDDSHLGSRVLDALRLARFPFHRFKPDMKN